MNKTTHSELGTGPRLSSHPIGMIKRQALGRAAQLGLCTFAFICALVALICGVFGQKTTNAYFTDADTLLPATVAQQLVRHDYAWTSQNWPRVPSLPDMLLFGLGELAHLDWRVTTLLYSSLLLISGIALMAWLASIIGRRPLPFSLFWTAISVTGALLLTTLEAASLQPGWQLPIIALIPVTHGDALLLSLVAFGASLGGLRGHRIQASIAYSACLAGAFSDALWYPYFLAPFLFAIAVTCVLPEWPAKRRKMFVFADAPAQATIRAYSVRVTLATAIGSLLQFLLPRQSLPGAELHFSDFSPSSVAAIVSSTAWSTICFVVLGAVAGYMILAASRHILLGRNIEFARAFLVLGGAASCVASTVVMLALHSDTDSYRYALPLLWWPIIFVVALGRWTGALTAWIAALGAIAVAVTFVPLNRPALVSWHSPLERCIHSKVDQFGLHAGLATYWYSRPTMASSDWTLQVDQVRGDGSIYIWGNNVAAYRHDLHDSGRAPFYNFVLLDESMDRGKLESRWGPPVATFVCGHVEIWTYDHSISPAAAPSAEILQPAS